MDKKIKNIMRMCNSAHTVLGATLASISRVTVNHDENDGETIANLTIALNNLLFAISAQSEDSEVLEALGNMRSAVDGMEDEAKRMTAVGNAALALALMVLGQLAREDTWIERNTKNEDKDEDEEKPSTDRISKGVISLEDLIKDIETGRKK
jgi:hypothetical protein